MSSEREQALAQIADIAHRYGIEIGDIAAALQQRGGSLPAARSAGVIAQVLGYLGAILVLAGLALFVGMQWPEFSSAVRVLVTLGAGFAIYLFAVTATTDPRFERVVTPLLLVAALLQPTGIVVMLNEYAPVLDPSLGLLFMCGLMFTQQFLTFLARGRSVLLFTSIFFAAAGFGVACDFAGIDFDGIALALGVGLMAVCYTVDGTRHRGITPFWYLAGSIFLLSGVFQFLEGTPLEILFFGVAAAVMYLATVVRSRTLLFVSVIALTSFTGYFFRDSLANAFGLIVMGMLLVGLSAFAMRLNRRYIRDRSVGLPGPGAAENQKGSGA